MDMSAKTITGALIIIAVVIAAMLVYDKFVKGKV